MSHTGRSSLALLSVAALCLSCSGASDLLLRSRHAVRLERAAPVSRTELRAALLSIEYYGRRVSSHLPMDLPPSLHPLPLDQAAQTLARDRSRYGRSRRIRAIALLASVGLDRPEYREALRILGANLEELEHLVGYTPLPWPESEPVGPLPPPTPGRPRPPVLPPCAIRERIHVHLGLARAISSCTKGIASSSVPTTDKNGVTTVTVAIDVKRPLAQLAPAIDPQNWDECSVFFDAAYVAKQVMGVVSLASSGDPEIQPGPPPPGTTWSGILFENFDLTASPTTSPAYFKNLLAIATNRGSYAFGSQLIDYFSFSYALDRVIADPFPFDIEVDTGDVSAIETSDDWLSLQASKSVKFSNGVLGDELEVYLGALAGEVNESVCCTPGVSSLAEPPAAPILLP